MAEAIKKSIVLKTRIGDKLRELVGRFLGFVKDDEFNAIMNNPKDLGQKIWTRPTIGLTSTLARHHPAGLRLVMTMRLEDGKDVTANRQLFITDRISMVSTVDVAKRTTVIKLANGEFLQISEVDSAEG
jgi:hypothetical protein